jgi:hypothetical protein
MLSPGTPRSAIIPALIFFVKQEMQRGGGNPEPDTGSKALYVRVNGQSKPGPRHRFDLRFLKLSYESVPPFVLAQCFGPHFSMSAHSCPWSSVELPRGANTRQNSRIACPPQAKRSRRNAGPMRSRVLEWLVLLTVVPALLAVRPGWIKSAGVHSVVSRAGTKPCHFLLIML